MKESLTRLKNMNGKEAAELIANNHFSEIAKECGAHRFVVRDILIPIAAPYIHMHTPKRALKRQYGYLIKKAVEHEMTLGTRGNKCFVTKHGYLKFDGNGPLIEQKTPLQIAIANYKLMLNQL